MVFNATFNNITILSVEETGVNRENHRPLYPQKWAHLKHDYIQM